MAQTRSPNRSQVTSFPTPRLEDILVVEERDSLANKFIEYGEPHPESAKYPNHKLVFVEPAERDPAKRQRWYYAADREDQDDYNFEISYPYAGLEEFPRIQRTYVLPREDYEPLDKGSLDPRGDGSDPENALFEGARLVFEETKRISKEFDSRFVVVNRIYDRVPDEAQQELYNWEAVYPTHGRRGYPRYQRKYVLPRNDSAPLKPGTPDRVFPKAKLVKQSESRFNDPLADSLYVLVVRTYEEFDAEPVVTDDIELNRDVPRRFRHRTRTIRRRKIGTKDSQIIREPFGGDPTTGDFPKELKITLGPEGDLERATHQTDILEIQYDTCTLSGQEIDPETGLVLPITQQLVPAGTAATAIDSDGIYTEVSPLNCNFSVLTTRKATTMADSDRTYDTHLHYSWPAVLRAVQFFTVKRKDEFGVCQTDGQRYHVTYKDGYSGPCKATVTDSWSQTAPAVGNPTYMVPDSVDLNFVNLRFVLRTCLHFGFSVAYSIGTDHPTYCPITFSATVAATNYIDWPSYIDRISVRPYKKGFLKRVERIYSPS